jgi:abortive infection bacteriophage resistance protein
MSVQGNRTLKPFKTFPDQLQVLRSRGMEIHDETAALTALQRVGYYRLSGYFYPLRKTKSVGENARLDEFVEGATLDLVIQIADFDKKLRLLTLYAIESIEISVRVAVAHCLGRLEADAHRHPELLDGRFTSPKRDDAPSDYDLWIEKFDQLCAKSKEEFIVHHQGVYGGLMPIWVAIEAWDFGLLSRFFTGMKFRDKNAIARKYGLQDGEVLRSWLRTFNFIRNVAAHHSRLWNRINTEIPRLPPLEGCRWLEPLHKDPDSLRRLFGALTLLRFMLRVINPDSVWHWQIKQHIGSFPESDLVSLKSAGFPQRWQDLPIWE